MATTQLINPDSFLIPHTVTLETLFQADHFVVPDYQRDYSWGRQQASELWNDLEKAAKNAFPNAGQAVANPLPHFIGAIVVQRFSDKAAQPPEVMDGQQRMVTLSILLSVLIEFAHRISEIGLKNSWTRTLEGAVASYAAGSLVPRIRLARDHAHYEALVCIRYTKLDRDAYYVSLGVPSKRSVVYRVKEVADFFHARVEDFLSGLSGASFDTRFVELCRSILQLTVALRMSVTEQGVAYEVFETLNDRGLDLQQADLLKSKLVALGDRQGAKAQVVAAWERIVNAIESQKLMRTQEYSLTDFFFFHYLAVVNPAISRSELYGQVSKHLGAPGTSALAYIQDVAECAERLQQILEAGPTYASVVRDIEAIRDIFPNKYATCILIAAARSFGATDVRTLEAIRLVHRFVFRRFIVERTELSTYAGEISEIANKLSSGALSTTAMLAADLKAKSNDAQFTHELS